MQNKTQTPDAAAQAAPDGKRLTLSVPEAARRLGVSTRTMYDIARRADFPSFRVSENRIVVSAAGLEAWVEA